MNYDYKHPVGTDTWQQPFLRGSGILKWSSKPFVNLDIKIDYLPDPCIIAANHRSMADFIVGLTACHSYPRPTRVMVSDRYFKGGPIAQFLRYSGAFATPSKNAGEALDMGITELRRGNSAIIMPEGKLSKPEDRVYGVGKLHRGVSILGSEAGVPIVPVAVLGTEELWRNGERPTIRPWRRPRVLIEAGIPLTFAADDHDANLADLRTALADLLVGLEKKRIENGWELG